MNLMELYNLKLERYYKTGIKAKPNNLLAILLLSHKDDFSCTTMEPVEFYLQYKKLIDLDIVKMIDDFDFRDEDFRKIIINQLNGYNEKNYEQDRFWCCFSEGIRALQYGLYSMPFSDGKDMYDSFFSKSEKINIKKMEV